MSWERLAGARSPKVLRFPERTVVFSLRIMDLCRIIGSRRTSLIAF